MRESPAGIWEIVDMTGKEHEELAAELVAKMRALGELADTEKREMTAEEQESDAAMVVDCKRHLAAVEREKRNAGLSDAMGSGGDRNADVGNDDVDTRKNANKEAENTDRDRAPTEEDRSIAIRAWARGQVGAPLSTKQEEAAHRCGIHPTQRDLTLQLPSSDYGTMQRNYRVEGRALSAVKATSGAVLIPEGFVPSLETALLEFGGMRQVSEVFRTATGNDMPWPMTNDTANKGEFVGENTAANEQDVTFSALVLKAHKASSKLVRVPSELITDSAIDVPSTLGRMLGERIARITNERYTLGFGAKEPQGVVPAATTGVTAASGTAIIADELIDLVHSVDPAYRPQSIYMMHDNVLLAIRKLKDGNGNYMWQMGNIQTGEPATLNGHRFVINQDMSSTITSTDITMAFGDFSKYKIRDVNQVMLRLSERYAEYDQEGFIAFMRTDGGLLDAGTHPVKTLVMA